MLIGYRTIIGLALIAAVCLGLAIDLGVHHGDTGQLWIALSVYLSVLGSAASVCGITLKLSWNNAVNQHLDVLQMLTAVAESIADANKAASSAPLGPPSNSSTGVSKANLN